MCGHETSPTLGQWAALIGQQRPLMHQEAGRCLEVLEGISVCIGSTFPCSNKEGLCPASQAEAVDCWVDPKIWNFLPGWSKGLRQVGLCHVPPRLQVPSSGSTYCSITALLRGMSRCLEVIASQHGRQEEAAILSPLCRGEPGIGPATKLGTDSRLFRRQKDTGGVGPRDN